MVSGFYGDFIEGMRALRLLYFLFCLNAYSSLVGFGYVHRGILRTWLYLGHDRVWYSRIWRFFLVCDVHNPLILFGMNLHMPVLFSRLEFFSRSCCSFLAWCVNVLVVLHVTGVCFNEAITLSVWTFWIPHHIYFETSRLCNSSP